MIRPVRILGIWCISLASLFHTPSHSAEGAAGFYMLGSKGPMAGYLPPPGAYVMNYALYYAGDTDAALEFAGLEVSGGIEAKAFYDLPVGLWVAPTPVLGGNFALSLIVPFGWKEVDAGIAFGPGPLGNILEVNVQDSQFSAGDPVPGATLGWHRGNWHWTVGVLVNVPIGSWTEGDLANIGFNRTAVDTSAAVTWLDPQRGLDASVAAGVTYNFENPDTAYKTGVEFHTEWALTQNFSKSFGIGVGGYYYEQVTGDSGPGARLGPLKGQAVALGPSVNYNFNIGRVPVTSNFKYLFEFETRNRLKGEVALLTVTIPLAVAPPSD